MDRREFIEALVVALATPTVAQVVPEKRGTISVKGSVVRAPERVVANPRPGQSFDPKLEYGQAVHVNERSPAGITKAKEAVVASARQLLPKGTKFYVLDGGSARVYGAGGQEEIDMLAWFYTPKGLEHRPHSGRVICEVLMT